jgi:Uma2 family endonuclease
MSTASPAVATLDDLYRTEGKAELIAGRIVHLMPTGFRPGLVGGRIYRSLDDHVTTTGRGVALPDGVGFVVPRLASGRRSFSPDAAYYLGPLPSDEMEFIHGPPTLVVEVRGELDHGSAEAEMAAKRADYFEAGTLVVWDVDVVAGVVRKHRSDEPAVPIVHDAKVRADAEPAVSGWSMAVKRIFE